MTNESSFKVLINKKKENIVPDKLLNHVSLLPYVGFVFLCRGLCSNFQHII